MFDENYKKRINKLKAINQGDWEQLKDLTDPNVLKDISTDELMVLAPLDVIDYR